MILETSTVDLISEEFLIKEAFGTECLLYDNSIENTKLEIKLEDIYIEPNAPAFITESLAKTYKALPYKLIDNELYVAMKYPENAQAIKAIRFASNRLIIPVHEVGERLDEFIEYHYRLLEFEELLKFLHIPRLVKKNKPLITKKQSKVIIRLIDLLIELSVHLQTSDIHIEPGNSEVQVRFRVSGLLRSLAIIPLEYYPIIVNRLKLMAKLNIAEKKRPQDGSIHIERENIRVSIRISTIASTNGEKIVLRVLSKNQFIRSEAQLGFSETNLLIKRKIMKNSQGIIIVAGPTGSGKTTTLYSLLQELNESKYNLATIEEPVEYQMKGITQIPVSPKYGLTFSNVLRSVLRQDPDVILIGEIRDSETAEIAFTASITGHLILTSIHTSDTVSAILRLKNLGIEPYFIASSLRGIIAQRLVNTLCPRCKEAYKPSLEEIEFLQIKDNQDNFVLYRGKGCDFCQHTGYHGNIAVHEVLGVNEEIRKLIENFETDKILEKAIESGTRTLFQDSYRHVINGIMSINELYGIVTQS